MRLGFSVRVLGKPGLRGYDGRRAANSPHLSVSLAHLRDVLSYLEASRIGMYRMARISHRTPRIRTGPNCTIRSTIACLSSRRSATWRVGSASVYRSMRLRTSRWAHAIV